MANETKKKHCAMREEQTNTGGAKQELPQSTQSPDQEEGNSKGSFLKEGEQLIVIPFRTSRFGIRSAEKLCKPDGLEGGKQ